jgi:aspartate 4-decarboxylase
MDRTDLGKMSELSPFELKDTLIKFASRHSERSMLNAGRGNPNFLATAARHGFFQLGLFAMSEAERSSACTPEGVGGLPKPEGIAARFEKFVEARQETPGISFLSSALSYVCEQLGCSDSALLQELVEGVLGCNYPSPVRMLTHTEKIVRHFLRKKMNGGRPLDGKIDLFAVEGATAGITYIFNSLRENRLIAAGDTIAIGVPIFAPYIEIPQLNDYRLIELAVEADPEAGWQYPKHELDKLLDPKVKAFFLVNPGNPSSVKIGQAGLSKISEVVTDNRKDLIILTDDVYATFADDFISLFSLCPKNTILLYSFSKYFGATGWRLGVIALHQNNVLDEKISGLPEPDQVMLDERYRSLAIDPRALRFIDRVVADNRSVALNHTAGLSAPQQVQMALFALFALMDQHDAHKAAMKRMIRGRYQTLYRELGFEPPKDPNASNYYTILDLEVLGARQYGRDFVDWLLRNKNPIEILFRLAQEGGVVLLPGKGFGTPHPSARVSLANLDEADYAKIGRMIRTMMQEYANEYQTAERNSFEKGASQCS